jgi:hypothetical protein
LRSQRARLFEEKTVENREQWENALAGSNMGAPKVCSVLHVALPEVADVERAVQALEEAHEGGCPKACEEIGQVMADSKKMIEYMGKAIETALLLLFGAKDPSEAIRSVVVLCLKSGFTLGLLVREK